MLLTLVVIKYFDVFKCVRDYQIQNLVETKFVDIFGRPKQILQPSAYGTLNDFLF